jgi:Fungal chitosanase of glycosyl hydrolase group 75
MSREVLLYIGGVPVYLEEDESVSWVGEMTIDADGSPRAYGPQGCCPEPLDYLANAGYEGNWWGIVTDSYGQPFVQEVGNPLAWPYPGLYLSTTDYLVLNFGKYDARHYLDSEQVLFMVVPDKVRMAVAPKVLGCRGVVTDLKTGRRCECVVGDIGPSDHMGEGSIALATYFGISGCPKTGGSSDRERWHYQMWPGQAAEGFALQ